MNMKKSIAGVMSGAMAVSAMAAVVSADQETISLTYDLKTYVDLVNDTKAKVTVVANYQEAFVNPQSWYYDEFDKAHWCTDGSSGVWVGDPDFKLDKCEWPAGAVDKNKNGLLDPDELAASGANYNPYDGIITFGVDNGFITGGPIYNDKGVLIGEMVDKDGNTLKGAMKEFEFTATPYKNLITEEEGKPVTFLATNYADSVSGAYYDKNLGKAYYNMGINLGNGQTGKLNLTSFDLYALGYSNAAKAEAAGVQEITDHSYAFKSAVAKMTYEIPNKVYLNKANGWGWNSDLDEAELEKVFNNFFKGTSFYGDVDLNAENFTKGFWNASGSKKGMIKPVTALASEPTTVAVGNFEAGAVGTAVIPFKTTLKPEDTTWVFTDSRGRDQEIVTKENNVVWALQNRKAGGNYYTKPVAVINDAIANHTNVTFTFTSYDGYVATAKSHAMNQWVTEDRGYDYKTSDFDWHNPTFGQHLYTNIDDSYSLFDTDDYDRYGSFSSAWGINLFTGAVVVNNGLTMQLSDTDTFNWGSNTLSFDWFDITDEGKVTDAKTFLTSMLLYTPVDWYWNTLTVVVTDEEREDIDAGAGLEDEAEVIEDEEPVDEVVEDEPEETEAPETEAPAPVEPAPSPATGNAPVALAVIPVALAAAAVVAKKRG